MLRKTSMLNLGWAQGIAVMLGCPGNISIEAATIFFHLYSMSMCILDLLVFHIQVNNAIL